MFVQEIWGTRQNCMQAILTPGIRALCPVSQSHHEGRVLEAQWWHLTNILMAVHYFVLLFSVWRCDKELFAFE
eukprot:COSAG02_NODE_5836_length_4001_cov_5.624552_2_plen_73_part_00